MPCAEALAQGWWPMLEKFRQAKMAEIAHLRQAASQGSLASPKPGPSRGFASAITRKSHPGPLPVIAEYKRASPSRGIICKSVPVDMAALQYAQAGAAAMSILTEEQWFGGQFAYMAQASAAFPADSPLPILRKDFIFDPLQIWQTAASPAGALLLIVRLVPGASFLRSLIGQAESSGLDCVVEVFDMADLQIAREAGAKIIHVNARDLDTLKVSRQACLELARNGRPQAGEIWIAASGMEEAIHLRMAADAGFNAALVGTALMAEGKPGASLSKLLESRN